MGFKAAKGKVPPPAKAPELSKKGEMSNISATGVKPHSVGKPATKSRKKRGC